MCAERYDEDETDVADARLWLIVMGIVAAVALVAAAIGLVALLTL